MKNFLSLFVLLCLLSCSTKPKIKRSDKQQSLSQQRLKTIEAKLLRNLYKDSSRLHIHQAELYFQTWNLKGQVQLLEDGSILADEVELYSWTNKEQRLQESKSLALEALGIDIKDEAEETTFSQNIEAKYKHTPKSNFIWWGGILVFLILVVLWKILIRYVRL